MICCTNGCVRGGHVCSHSNEFCKSIACAEPFCGEGVQPITSPFRCCPFCPPTPPSCEVTGDIKRKGRKVITTFSTEHPDVTFRCKCGRRRRFRPCTSPLKFRARRGVNRVMVEAECSGMTTSKLFTIRVL
ncbi:uncharacterized protein [Dysidea avara]|uniref:uncharacterized protein n=1 Tax=Dysidea avara TaxID=196820 RepID=UPI003323CD48